jgi:hypothetical protein
LTTEEILAEIDRHQFVFIGGLHRSGTSILFKCLKEHPSISGFDGTGVPEDEGQFLQSVYPIAQVYGGPGKFGFYSEMHLTENSPLVTDENRRKIFVEWSRYWDLQKPILMDKSPPNILKTRFLQALFPHAKFIVIIRHPIAVALATEKWSKSSLESLIEHWVLCHNILYQDKKYLNHYLELNYTYFVKYPHKTLKNIYHFLSVQEKSISIEIDPRIDQKYFTIWKNLERKIIYKRVIYDIIDKYEESVNRFGYSFLKY